MTGHTVLSQIKRSGGPGRGRKVWKLVLNYFGPFFIAIFNVIIVILLATGVGVGVQDKVLPLLHK